MRRFRIIAVIAVLVTALATALTAGSAIASSYENANVHSEVIAVAVKSVKVKGTVLADVKLRGTQTQSRRCHWTHGGFWNSGHSANGGLFWFWDRRPGKLCPNSHSPSGWVKVAGGVTGRPCHNPARENGRPPSHIVRGHVTMVESFAKFFVRAYLIAKAHAHAALWCGAADGYGVAQDWVRVNYRALIKASGNARIKLAASLGFTARERAAANASVTCTTSDTPPPTTCDCSCDSTQPGCHNTCDCKCDSNQEGCQQCQPCQPCNPCHVDHAPQISGVLPAHEFEGGSAYMWFEASDPDGDTLAVNVKVSAGTAQYAHVAGVIPTDVRWDGSPCPAGVSCYRATLWGDSPGTAHIIATVNAGGKTAQMEGDVPIKAQPNGGFKRSFNQQYQPRIEGHQVPPQV